MPYKRKRSFSSSMSKSKKPRFRSSKYSRGKLSVIKRGRIAVNCHRFIRWATSPLTLTCTLATDNKFAEYFSLDKVQNYTEFTNLYDQFQITGVQVMFQLITNPDASTSEGSTNQAQAANWYPKLWYCRDYDDSNTNTVADLKQRPEARMRVLRPNSIFKVFIKPKASIQLYNGVSATGYGIANKMWLDVSSSSTPYYGLKYVVDLNGIAATANYPFKVLVEYKYWIRFKNPR